MANGIGRGHWRIEISFFQLYYTGTLVNVVGKVEYNLRLTELKAMYIAGCQTNISCLNLLKPNDIYICRNAALTSRRYILNIYSTIIHIEYFKNAS